MYRIVISHVPRANLVAVRQLHASAVTRKTVTEKVSEVAEKVNKSVGRGLAGALEKGEEATEATKQTLGAKTEETKRKAEEASTVAGQKANEAGSAARKTKEDAKENFSGVKK
ncbi:hypothetical protein JAAARDRAFT_350738 [Jaapia argillacea MUCL 33604]|uniref:Uncharacterized protein n=1 Tax=Jaapia argillacea MUCL 33604 TaxID=933084 RepID=A0A067PU70_9AGAM|nr:hypothetical protein JAAARDRAFT_350738 [Jaapia argillacea MUCL 33604]